MRKRNAKPKRATVNSFKMQRVLKRMQQEQAEVDRLQRLWDIGVR